MRQPPDPREDEDDGEEGDGMEPTLPLDQTLNNYGDEWKAECP
ncbi:hypothetical protein PENPOL_c002G01487 [Penicillium polonicum]|uniref:Uncharacterized protein n=1 Tax=Penicillium polonicum TaxID=60169 RepID=A0A1V6NYT3_PENPO|nr:hypothetical protein PENPOL_c002G01487 [Penicillium polonicum]